MNEALGIGAAIGFVFGLIVAGIIGKATRHRRHRAPGYQPEGPNPCAPPRGTSGIQRIP